MEVNCSIQQPKIGNVYIWWLDGYKQSVKMSKSSFSYDVSNEGF